MLCCLSIIVKTFVYFYSPLTYKVAGFDRREASNRKHILCFRRINNHIRLNNPNLLASQSLQVTLRCQTKHQSDPLCQTKLQAFTPCLARAQADPLCQTKHQADLLCQTKPLIFMWIEANRPLDLNQVKYISLLRSLMVAFFMHAFLRWYFLRHINSLFLCNFLYSTQGPTCFRI